MKYYCLRDKNGKLHEETLGKSIVECWFNGGFDFVSSKEGQKWRKDYWCREQASIKSAKRLGYSFQEMKLVQVDR
jgi:hypothetical protein